METKEIKQIKTDIYLEIMKDLEGDDADIEKLYDKYTIKAAQYLNEDGKVE